MTRLEGALRAIGEELDRRGLAWALVGGIAVGTRAEPRTTRDIDIVVSVGGDAEAERLVADLRGSGYRILSALEHREMERLATVRLAGPEPCSPVVDLLFASSGIEDRITRDAQRLEVVPGLRVPIARTGHLIVLKLLARDDRTRPQDAGDLRALILHADPEDLDLARRSIRDVEDAGATRGRDLAAALDELVHRSRRDEPGES